MRPLDGVADAWCLGAADAKGADAAWLFYSPKGDAITLAKPGLLKNCTRAVWFDVRKGRAQKVAPNDIAAGDAVLRKPGAGAWLLFVAK